MLLYLLCAGGFCFKCFNLAGAAILRFLAVSRATAPFDRSTAHIALRTGELR